MKDFAADLFKLRGEGIFGYLESILIYSWRSSKSRYSWGPPGTWTTHGRRERSVSPIQIRPEFRIHAFCTFTKCDRASKQSRTDEGVIYLLSHAHSICWIQRESGGVCLLQTLLRACRYYVDISTILSKGHSHVTSEFFWDFGPRTLSPFSLSISNNL